jgi:hypothetical protein
LILSECDRHGSIITLHLDVFRIHRVVIGAPECERAEIVKRTKSSSSIPIDAILIVKIADGIAVVGDRCTQRIRDIDVSRLRVFAGDLLESFGHQ